MKRRGWLLLGCTALLSTALLQPVLAHDRGYDDYDYGRPMMGGPGFQGGYPYTSKILQMMVDRCAFAGEPLLKQVSIKALRAASKAARLVHKRATTS